MFCCVGALLISGGGTEVRIWNTLGAGQLLTKLDNFVKTVTALQVFQPRPTGAVARKIGTTIHLLTGSLDGNLRVSKITSNSCQGDLLHTPSRGALRCFDCGSLSGSSIMVAVYLVCFIKHKTTFTFS